QGFHASPAAGIAGSATLSRAFEYDALYRLLQATGRESGSFANSATPWSEGYYVPDASVSNTRGYTQNYTYDRLGNMLHLHHQASGNTFHRYLNDYSNNAAAFEMSNLATEISYGGTTVSYAFDACGNQVSEGTSRHMGWDYGDRMRTYATQVGTSEPTVYAHYLYDAGGNRVKKIVRKSTGNTEVTIYIDGGMEYLYELDGATKVQEMNEIHVMDGRSRIARVREVLLSSWTGAAPVAVLYNLEDHLGNACFSLTATGGDYSREEYFPFGEMSFRDFGKERYRFCGKERDGESGLYYYGARYYAPWACRFVSIDPLAGEYPFYTPYQYAGNKPVNFIDLDGLELSNSKEGNSPNPQAKSSASNSKQQSDHSGKKLFTINIVVLPIDIDKKDADGNGALKKVASSIEDYYVKNAIYV
ncbi:MAG: RHS repeat-associated core domain-containing protein, partial [bacterium]|nr:RHS repeat-associated core domain-containing protein [bacterium]